MEEGSYIEIYHQLLIWSESGSQLDSKTVTNYQQTFQKIMTEFNKQGVNRLEQIAIKRSMYYKYRAALIYGLLFSVKPLLEQATDYHNKKDANNFKTTIKKCYWYYEILKEYPPDKKRQNINKTETKGWQERRDEVFIEKLQDAYLALIDKKNELEQSGQPLNGEEKRIVKGITPRLLALESGLPIETTKAYIKTQTIKEPRLNSQKNKLTKINRNKRMTNWRVLMWENTFPALRNSLAVLMLTGVRPSEIENGLVIRQINEDELLFEILGAKHKHDEDNPAEQKGLRKRFISVATRNTEDEMVGDYLHKLLNECGGKMIICQSSINIRNYVLKTSKKIFKHEKYQISAYLYREVFQGKLKAEGFSKEEIAIASGHRSCRTQGSYATASQYNAGEKSGGRIMDVRFEDDHVTVIKNTAVVTFSNPSEPTQNNPTIQVFLS